jgi:hypothetical protein
MSQAGSLDRGAFSHVGATNCGTAARCGDPRASAPEHHDTSDEVAGAGRRGLAVAAIPLPLFGRRRERPSASARGERALAATAGWASSLRLPKNVRRSRVQGQGPCEARPHRHSEAPGRPRRAAPPYPGTTARVRAILFEQGRTHACGRTPRRRSRSQPEAIIAPQPIGIIGAHGVRDERRQRVSAGCCGARAPQVLCS